MDTLTGNFDLTAVSTMSRDIRAASESLGDKEARFLVDLYYQLQHLRIGAGGQIRAMREAEPHGTLVHFETNFAALEGQAKGALERYAKGKRVGRWLLGITGIGPVITAGLLAHIDIEKAPVAGNVWSFAGLDPSVVWEKGKTRPWNADLKRLAFLAGESFVKMQSRQKDFYGELYSQFRVREWEANLAGRLAHRAAEELAKKNIGKDTTAYTFYAGLASPSRVKAMLTAEKQPGVPATYRGGENVGDEIPMLPPAHIHARARRVTVKIFLSHVHEAMFWDRYETAPPKIYSIAHLEHVHKIEPPNGWWQ